MLLHRVDTTIEMVEKAFVFVGLGVFFLIVPYTTIDVILRYFFNSPMLGSVELGEISMAILLFLCMGSTTRFKEHLSVEIFASRLDPNKQVILERIGYLMGFILFALIVWQGTKIGLKMWHRNETTAILDLPRYGFRLLLPIGAFLACLESILHFIKTFTSDKNLEAGYDGREE